MNLGATVAEMGARGFRGPFAMVCDGVPSVIVFHGPDVPSEPVWLDGRQSPFCSVATVNGSAQVSAGRVLDCKAYCSNSPMFILGDHAAKVQEQCQRTQSSDGSTYRDCFPSDVQRSPCLLAYPMRNARPSSGPQAIAECMEDLWNIYLFSDYFYFVRSWTGTVRYRAQVCFRDQAMFITGVEAPANSSNYDPNFSVRQVDFLVKSLLYRVLAPVPVPVEVGPDSQGIANYALTEYGRWGWYPSFDDTTAFRIWLNGAVGWFVSVPGHLRLLESVHAVEAHDTPNTRKALYAELGRDNLYQSIQIEGGHAANGPLGTALPPNTSISFVVEACDGRPCLRGYTDPTFRLEQGAYFEVPAPALCRMVLEQHAEAGLVLNPGGPYSCVLGRQEVAMIARAG